MGINVLYRYNKTVKVWLFRDTGSIHYPSPKFISLGSASGNKPGLGVMEIAYIPHNHTLTVYYDTVLVIHIAGLLIYGFICILINHLYLQAQWSLFEYYIDFYLFIYFSIYILTHA